MKHSVKIAASVAVLVLFLFLSLNIVFAVNQTSEPGSDQDPIISKSYVDAAVKQLDTALQKLQTQVDALKTENTQLAAKLANQEQTIKELQQELKGVKPGSAAASGNNDTGTGGNTGNTGTTGNNGTTVNNGSTVNDGGKSTPSNGKGTVNTAILNIRKQPNTTSPIVAKAVKGDTLTLVSKSGNWYMVKTSKGVTGYVMATLITVKK